jgi:spermidine synthase
VGGDPNQLFEVSLSEACPPAPVNQLALVIDATAGTVLTRYDGDPASVAFLKCDHTNLVHYIRDDAKVAIIGTGGGRDVLSAIAFGQPSITGIELNDAVISAVNDAYGDFTGHLDRQPGVRFVNDEARSYLARSDERYDVIQISFIDTWAATAAGAYALSENGLYTVEGWDTFLDRLEPNGVLSVSRFYSFLGEPPLEAYRLTALATETLTRRGIEDTRAHVLMYEGPSGPYGVSTATTLISPDPFSATDVRVIQEEADRLGFRTVLTPDRAADPLFEGLASAETLDATIDGFTEDIAAPTDDRPFFFQMANVETIFSDTILSDHYLVRPFRILLILSFAVVVLTVVCIAVPLLIASRRWPGAAAPGMSPFYVFFAAIGLGFLLVEVAQLQRLILYLGHPTHALSVVLFSLLLSSGVGSLLSERLSTDNRRVIIGAFALLFAAVAAAGIATPELIQRYDSVTMNARIALSVALLMPVGLLMGLPFPIGMRIAASHSAPTTFLWGINGATSVCASVLGTAIALLWGISASFWVGAACYAIAGISLSYVLVRVAAPVVRQVPSAMAEQQAGSD